MTGGKLELRQTGPFILAHPNLRVAQVSNADDAAQKNKTNHSCLYFTRTCIPAICTPLDAHAFLGCGAFYLGQSADTYCRPKTIRSVVLHTAGPLLWKRDMLRPKQSAVVPTHSKDSWEMHCTGAAQDAARSRVTLRIF